MKLSRGIWKLRPLVIVFLLVFGLWWVVDALYSYISDVCQGHQHAKYLCQQYKRGTISGSMCPKLCDRMEITLTNCIRQEQSFSTFLWRSWEIHVENRHVPRPKSGSEEVSRGGFLMPQQGQSMEELRDMVTKLVQSKLGSGDHGTIVDRTFDLADVNKDAKVSLAEAKTIWALLHINEFFIHFVFSDSEHVPSLQGFCGDAYAYDYFRNRMLYQRDRIGFLYWLFPNHHRWFFPRWAQRAKIVVGLLEFTMEAYQHGSDGAFLMCDVNESKIGYSDKQDVKILDAGTIIPAKQVLDAVVGRPCSSTADCEYTPQCATECSAQRCNNTILRPSLHYVCQIIEEYILQDAPSELFMDMDRLLGRCTQLGKENTKAQVEHSLILNDLKLLLWKHISYQNL